MPSLPDYGIDAPKIVRNNTLCGILLIGVGLAVFFVLVGNNPKLAATISERIGITGLILLAQAVYMLWSSKVGKFSVVNKLVSAVSWRGDEQVLDIGCGRGIALIAAAKRLSSGRAVGIDLWSQVDLSANTASTTLANAKAEHVEEKVSLDTGDARALPYAGGMFDIVLSMTALHNIKERTGRETALAEAVRVLRPGGRLAIFDIFRSGEYQKWLRQNRMENVTSFRLYLLWMVPGRIVTAKKPIL